MALFLFHLNGLVIGKIYPVALIPESVPNYSPVHRSLNKPWLAVHTYLGRQDNR